MHQGDMRGQSRMVWSLLPYLHQHPLCTTIAENDRNWLVDHVGSLVDVKARFKFPKLLLGLLLLHKLLPADVGKICFLLRC